MQVKEFKELLLKLKQFPSGAEVIYGDNIYEIIGLAYYPNLKNAIFEHPVIPMIIGEENKNFSIDEHIKHMYEVNSDTDILDIRDKYYYQHLDKWYYDFAPQTEPFLKGDIKVLNFYFNDRDLLKRCFEKEIYNNLKNSKI